MMNYYIGSRRKLILYNFPGVSDENEKKKQINFLVSGKDLNSVSHEQIKPKLCHMNVVIQAFSSEVVEA
jgi:hypothetical protein